VIGGYTEPRGSRTGFGSLLLGAYDGDGAFVYAGRVGTGFSARQLDTLHTALKEIEIGKRPFQDPVPEAKTAHWVRPVLVVDVSFTERTRAGVLRHPRFRGLRDSRQRIPDRDFVQSRHPARRDPAVCRRTAFAR
jgi:bifunctional non-homologous end joining protein LigD